MKEKCRCPFEVFRDLVGGGWKLHILWRLNINDFLEFTEIQEITHCASGEILSSQLKELEESGFIQRISYPEIPPRIEYHITGLGRSLWTVLTAMQDWSINYMQNMDIGVEEEVLEEFRSLKKDRKIQDLVEEIIDEKEPLDDYFDNSIE